MEEDMEYFSLPIENRIRNHDGEKHIIVRQTG